MNTFTSPKQTYYMHTTNKIHRFPHPVDNSALPEAFTFPFRYTPHPLCREAAAMVQTYLATRPEWREELSAGKMFGVLVVRSPEGIGFLAAFSGNLAGSNCHDYFVPPVYDMLQPEDFFKREEHNISEMNRRIEALEQSPERLQAVETWQRTVQETEAEMERSRQWVKSEKERRTHLRAAGVSPEQESAFIRESQFQKAEHRRCVQRCKERVEASRPAVEKQETEIHRLQEERKQRSATLQRQLFEQFRMRNARGEVRTLMELFPALPPSGSGECAAPKLLQYAYINHLSPVCMAEFWWGASPKGELREHGHFYPACQHKCGVILPFMLQGLTVEENPLATDTYAEHTLEVCWEDAYLLAINKPSGMLSVPGKHATTSAQERILQMRPDLKSVYAVHRLDMDTSGILLFAKSQEVQREMQRLFASREVHKTYLAELSGRWEDGVPQEGCIQLPLSPDYEHRPAQRVDMEHGKPSITYYNIKEKRLESTVVYFHPVTGRTHQLRIHAASPQGLHRPIVGDPLYGVPADRLHLHALRIVFPHPVTKEEVVIEAKLY
jgi:tRNA pseudouridine32 synthase/23S rRNA pseudouridine746 synthase